MTVSVTLLFYLPVGPNALKLSESGEANWKRKGGAKEGSVNPVGRLEG